MFEELQGRARGEYGQTHCRNVYNSQRINKKLFFLKGAISVIAEQFCVCGTAIGMHFTFLYDCVIIWYWF